MNERIKEIRKELGYSQEKFGSMIGFKKNSVSQLENGVNKPSEQTIMSICREFHVNEEWLRTGEGEMFVQLDKELELMEWAGKFLADESDTFRKRFVRMMMSLDESRWEFLEQKVKELFN